MRRQELLLHGPCCRSGLQQRLLAGRLVPSLPSVLIATNLATGRTFSSPEVTGLEEGKIVYGGLWLESRERHGHPRKDLWVRVLLHPSSLRQAYEKPFVLHHWVRVLFASQFTS